MGAERGVPRRTAALGGCGRPVHRRCCDPSRDQKLWMLNGAHSLLAYAGPIIGHRTVAEAAADSLPDLARPVVGRGRPAPAAGRPPRSAAYRAALLERFANAGSTTSWPGSPPTDRRSCRSAMLPVLRAERPPNRLPAGALRVVAAWICHLRGLGAPVSDARADEVVPLADGASAGGRRQGSAGMARSRSRQRFGDGVGRDRDRPGTDRRRKVNMWSVR